jgi:hypothetical protein
VPFVLHTILPDHLSMQQQWLPSAGRGQCLFSQQVLSVHGTYHSAGAVCCCCCHVACGFAEKRAAKSIEPDQAALKEQLTVQRSQRLAEVSAMHQHAKTRVVSGCVQLWCACKLFHLWLALIRVRGDKLDADTVITAHANNARQNCRSWHLRLTSSTMQWIYTHTHSRLLGKQQTNTALPCLLTLLALRPFAPAEYNDSVNTCFCCSPSPGQCCWGHSTRHRGCCSSSGP